MLFRFVKQLVAPLNRSAHGALTFGEVARPACEDPKTFLQRTPPHFQRDEDEAFYILEGTYTFLLGDEQIEARPGSFLFVPRATMHGFTNSGNSAARMLILTSPGGIHENFFAEVGEPVVDRSAPAPDGPVDLPRLVAVAEKYGIIIPPPPTN